MRRLYAPNLPHLSELLAVIENLLSALEQKAESSRVHPIIPPAYNKTMPNLDHIISNPEIMGGKACIRGMRVTVGTMVGLVDAGHSYAEILAAYPYIEEDLRQSLAYEINGP